MNKIMKQILGEVIIGLISFSLVGCDNNDSEVKELQKQIAKLDQQLNETEKKQQDTQEEKQVEQETQKEEEKAECAFCGKEDYIKNLNIRYIGSSVEGMKGEIDYYYCGKCQSNESEDFTCPICGGVNTCPENSECLNPPVMDKTYLCEECGCVGTCTYNVCYNPNHTPEYAGCWSCGISIMTEAECYRIEGDYHAFCKDCHDNLVNKYKYGACPECAWPLNIEGWCPDCGWNAPDDAFL